MALCKFQGQPLRLLFFMSVVPLFREHKRYFYVRERTGVSQWEFPTEEDKEEDPKDSPCTQAQALSQGDSRTSGSAGAVTGLLIAAVSSFSFMYGVP